MWASFTFEALQKWLDECRNGKTNDSVKASSPLVLDSEKSVAIGNQFSTVFNIEEKWFIPEYAHYSLFAFLCILLFYYYLYNCRKLPVAGNLLSAKNTQTGDSPKDSQDGPTELDATLKQNDKLWCQTKIKSMGRKFNMDLAPKVSMPNSFNQNILFVYLCKYATKHNNLYFNIIIYMFQLLFSRGTLVELLISSNISRYAEFRCVNRILTWHSDKLETVPCSRADVFATKNVGLIEKRQLMQLLTLCVEYKPESGEFKGFEDKTLKQYLESKNLTENLIHYVLYAIAMSNDTTPCMVGVEKTQRFLSSLGRYGNTPFLWPMYGTGELPQCFCRC